MSITIQISRPRRPLVCAISALLLGLAFGADAADSQPARLVGGNAPEVSHEIPPVASLTVATVDQLHRASFDQVTVAAPGGAARATLTTGGSDYVLLGSAATDLPRRMVAPTPEGGVAFLVKVAMPAPATSEGVTHTYYALATVVGTRIALWAFYEDLPGDQELLKKMTAVLARLEQPKLVFDPKFKAAASTDPTRFVLK